jgi:hypothetical protein
MGERIARPLLRATRWTTCDQTAGDTTARFARDQCVKLTLMPVEKITSFDFVPAMGGSVT